ncbi:WhiB family transcriptional regulator [Agromyces cerinus]|uniref:Transcriptional regulator WhiB n=1 Tax=Agromyces cerinus subsp. cerinus TaxID=232089 RepID=A0A1N6DPP7_9MICO|nr:WhiB family transcriptional regulator, redox-sensing transcriptional regulator [Agromyces cerinus subsp. cerinus]
MTLEQDDWRAAAACATTDPDMFSDDNWQIQERAKTICNTVCTVREQCLTEAMDNEEPFSVWGGLSARDRARLRKQTA